MPLDEKPVTDRPRVARIFVYPVKSLGGIELTECAVEERGLRHDRRWMLVDADGIFMSQRKFPHLSRVEVRLDPESLRLEFERMPPLIVPLAPSGGEAREVQVWRSVCPAIAVGLEADAWCSEVAGQPCRLVFMPDSTRRPVNPQHAGPDDIVSFADGYPLLVISEASLAELNARLSSSLPMDRFRPNLVVTGVPAHAEDEWRRMELPDAVLYGSKPCARCVVTTIDQARGQLSGPEPLRTLAGYRRDADGDVLFGQNLLVRRTGLIRVGDEIEREQVSGKGVQSTT